MVGSLSSGSSGPRPKISSRISRESCSRSAKLSGTASLFTELGIARRAAEFFEVEAIEDLAVQVGFDLLVLAPFEGLQIGHIQIAVALILSYSRLCTKVTSELMGPRGF
jgi:hypothetical protein